MDVLSPDSSSPHAPRLARIGSLATVLVVGACVLASQLESDYVGPRFNHSLHGEDAGLECASCHRTADSAEDAGMPSSRQCALCHKDLDDGKPPEQQAAFFFEGDEVKSAHVTDLSEEIRFSHQAHVSEYGLACSDCHGDVATSTAVAASARVTMEECIRCHQQRSTKQDDCATCHLEIRADRAPENHLQDWSRRHGMVVRMQGTAEAARCTLCHPSERDCIACHQAEPPADHTNYWRQRGHGIAVRINRERCNTCHQTDSCDRCHRDTAPRNHTAGWGSPLDRHCLTCHTPITSQESCSVCHKGTPSHALAAPMPPDHVPGMNCRQCHGLSAPLPHPDKGDSCEACHR